MHRTNLLLLAAIVGGGGCTTETSDAEAGVQLGGTVAMLALVRQSDGVASSELASSESMHASFAQYSGIESESVARLLGAELPASAEGCRLGPAGVPEFVSTEPVVDLLDVGPLRVKRGPLQDALWPRTFPEVGGVAEGVFYAADLQPSPAPTGYRIEADGSASLAGFRIGVRGPPELAELRVDDAPFGGLTRIQRTRGMVVRWAPGAGRDPGGMRDLIEVEVRSGGASLLCTAEDDGQVRVTAASLHELPADRSGRLIVRRLRVQSFEHPGFDLAYVKISTVRSSRASVR